MYVLKRELPDLGNIYPPDKMFHPALHPHKSLAKVELISTYKEFQRKQDWVGGGERAEKLYIKKTFWEPAREQCQPLILKLKYVCLRGLSCLPVSVWRVR